METAKTLLDVLGCNRELSIVITGDEEITSLNYSFRQKDVPTDVLSFPAGDESELPSDHLSLGDVVISIQTALRQARRYRVTREEEVVRLLVHGVLHLVGYEHEGVSAAVATRMRKREEELLSQLGYAPELSMVARGLPGSARRPAARRGWRAAPK